MSNATNTRNTLEAAARFLAQRCDYAVEDDGVGYNRYDTEFGHYLAETPAQQWSPKARRAAWKMLRKYRGQLSEGGIDFDAIPEPPDPEEEPVVKEKAKPSSHRIEIQDNLFLIRFPYDPALVSAVKEKVDGRKWNGQRWEAPLSALAAHTVLEFAEEHNFSLNEQDRRVAERMAAPVRKWGIRHISSVEVEGRERFRILFPFDRQVKDDLKRMVPGSEWTGDYWVAPHADAEEVQEFADLHGFRLTDAAKTVAEAHQTVTKKLQEESASTGEDTAPLAVEDRLGGTLRPFQRAGVRYGLFAKRAILADQMGLGKTVQALATVEADEAYPAVVVAPSSVKVNWAQEARKWLPANRTIQVLEGTTPGEVIADVVILNYAILSSWVDKLRSLEPQAVVLDESHYVKNGQAQRSQAARQLAEDVPLRLLLTGTPVLNRPAELIHQLKVLDRFKEVGGNWKRFVTRYCDAYHDGYGWNVQGADNLEELNERLRARCYVRRRKDEVLQDLPDKQRATVPVEIDNRAEYQRAHRDLLSWLRQNVGAAAAHQASRAEQLARISHLKQLAAQGKIKAAVRWIEDFLESGEKLVVFAHHRDVQQALYKKFQDRAVRITGGDSSSQRQDAVDSFQNEDKIRLLVGSLKAAGVGITLTAASDVAFVELGWTPADHDQAEDRVHRIGQEGSVTAWYLLAEQTIDEEVAALIDRKRQVVDDTTEGGEAPESESILAGLVGRLLKGE